MGAEGFRLQGRWAGVMGDPGGQEEGLPQSCTLQKTRRGDQGVAPRAALSASPPAGPPSGSWLAGHALTRPPRPAPAAGGSRRGSREARLGGDASAGHRREAGGEGTTVRPSPQGAGTGDVHLAQGLRGPHVQGAEKHFQKQAWLCLQG